MTEDPTPPMSRPRVAAGALFFDAQGRVLLVKPTYKDGWEIPGGYVEPGETPIEACEREIKEELGLDRKIERLLVVDWAPSTKEGDKVLFVFDGGELPASEHAAITLPPDELAASEFHDTAILHELMIERLARRLAAAVEARQTDVTRYLEHGVTKAG
jgi:8-oxo-dGTP diphosphatase